MPLSAALQPPCTFHFSPTTVPFQMLEKRSTPPLGTLPFVNVLHHVLSSETLHHTSPAIYSTLHTRTLFA